MLSGVGPNYNATKAIIMARGQLQMVDKEMNFQPYFIDVTIEDKNGLMRGCKEDGGSMGGDIEMI